jgi:hypothetical protein
VWPKRVFASGALIILILSISDVAWASSSGASTPKLVLPTDLWISPLAGGASALAVLAISLAISKPWKKPGGWTAAVPTTSAWDGKDSWVTNVTAVGTALTAVFSATAISTFLGNTDSDGFTVVSLLLGGVVVMGPVVYGAFSKKPKNATSAPNGSRVGLLLANLVTLLATFGLMAEIGHLVSYSTAQRVDKNLVYAALAAAAVVITIYAVRSTNAMIDRHSTHHEGGHVASMISAATRSSGTL